MGMSRCIRYDRTQGHIGNVLVLIWVVYIHTIFLVIWSCSIELVPILLGLWNDSNDSTANSYVAMGYYFTIRQHSKVGRINWRVITTSTEDDICFSCHVALIPLRYLSWKDARLIHNRVFIEWIWIVVLSSRYVFWGDILEDVQILVLACSITRSVCDRVFSSAIASKAWVHGAFIHFRHVKLFRLRFKQVLDLFSCSSVAHFWVISGLHTLRLSIKRCQLWISLHVRWVVLLRLLHFGDLLFVTAQFLFIRHLCLLFFQVFVLSQHRVP